MKRLVYILILLSCVSCEDVIDVDLDNSEPRLVIEASINWIEGTAGNAQDIRLSLTSPFFEETPSPVTTAEVFITSTNGMQFSFTQNDEPGLYETDSFVPQLNEAYTLTVNYNSNTYTSTAILEPVVPIDFVEQTMNGGFTGDDIEIKPNYTDPENEENFYFFSFEAPVSTFPALEVYEDEFTDGNQVFAYYSEEDLNPGDVVVIRSYGISERFYDFMFKLLSQTNSEVGGPFETQPATLRGNIVNTTSPDDFPLGYFRLSEVDEVIYTIE